MTDYLTAALKKYGLEKDSFLKILKECNAVVTGSFPLSVLLQETGNPSFEPGDIDIFIDGYSPVLKLEHYLGKALCSQEYPIEGYYQKDTERSTTYTYLDVSGTKRYTWYNDKTRCVQIILVKGCPKTYINTFDLTCCQTFIDNELGKVLTVHPRTLKMETEFTCTIHDLEKYCHWNNVEARFQKYYSRHFKFYLGEANITQVLFSAKKGCCEEVLKELLEGGKTPHSEDHITVKDIFLCEQKTKSKTHIPMKEILPKLSWGYIKNVYLKNAGKKLTNENLRAIVHNPDVDYGDLKQYFTEDRARYLINPTAEIWEREHPLLQLITDHPSWLWPWCGVRSAFKTLPWELYAKAEHGVIRIDRETQTTLEEHNWYRQELYNTIRKYPNVKWSLDSLTSLPDIPLDILDAQGAMSKHAPYLSRMSTITEDYISRNVDWDWDWNLLIKEEKIDKFFVNNHINEDWEVDYDLIGEKFGYEFAKGVLKDIDHWELYVKYPHIMLHEILLDVDNEDDYDSFVELKST